MCNFSTSFRRVVDDLFFLLDDIFSIRCRPVALKYVRYILAGGTLRFTFEPMMIYLTTSASHSSAGVREIWRTDSSVTPALTSRPLRRREALCHSNRVTVLIGN